MFDVTTGGPPVLVGIVAAKMKVAYRTTPGRARYWSKWIDGELGPHEALALEDGE